MKDIRSKGISGGIHVYYITKFHSKFSPMELQDWQKQSKIIQMC